MSLRYIPTIFIPAHSHNSELEQLQTYTLSWPSQHLADAFSKATYIYLIYITAGLNALLTCQSHDLPISSPMSQPRASTATSQPHNLSPGTLLPILYPCLSVLIINLLRSFILRQKGMCDSLQNVHRLFNRHLKLLTFL